MKPIKNNIKNVSQSSSGAAIIEFALVLPVLLLIIIGGIEYGLYFNKSQILQRAVSTTANSLQVNPASISQADAQKSGLAMFDLATVPNYICTDTATTQSDAAKGCIASTWNVSAPAATPDGGVYYAVVKAHLEYDNLTPLMKPFLPGTSSATTVDAIQVVTMTKANTKSTEGSVGCPDDNIVSGSNVYGQAHGYNDEGGGNDWYICCRDHKIIYWGSGGRSYSGNRCDESGGLNAAAKPK